tara:strand:+ start:34841 stop:37465 length:2625 start_codon:yes stop_codon:yes gene_type:complete
MGIWTQEAVSRFRGLLAGLIFITGAACGSSGGQPANNADGGPDAGETSQLCQAPIGADVTGTETYEDGVGGIASVEITGRETCRRSYALRSNAELRDNLPANPRRVSEAANAATLRSGNDIFDALYALALEEVRELSVDAVRDGAFANGQAVACGDGGCFETGRLWNYVWTRDAAYAIDLGLAGVDPSRSLNTLLFKLSERRSGGDTQIVQDTGTGGSYPVSSDRVAWALGASTLLHELPNSDREAFRAKVFEALSNTIEQDRRIVWDSADGLYRGEQSFLDWREQSYADWTRNAVVHIAMGKALSTNLLHLRSLEIASELAGESDEAEQQTRYRQWATELRQSIQSRFWLEEEGLFSSFIGTELDGAPARRFDLLSSAFAVLFGLASEAQAQRIVANYPHYGHGAPVLWPQQQDTPIYHNRGEWPFVTAYWLRAAAQANHHAVATRMVNALVRGTALNLSNMENFEASSGAPYVSEGATSGPVVNSQRQLWSVAGYLSMVHHTLFGLHPNSDGLAVEPYLSGELRNTLFVGTDSLVLNDYRFQNLPLRIILQLPTAGGSEAGYRVANMTLNGAPHTGPIAASMLTAGATVEVTLVPSENADSPLFTLVSDQDYRDVFAPRTPIITSVSEDKGSIALAIDMSGEGNNDIRVHVYRDGQRVASNLPASTQTFTDTEVDATAQTSHCYTIETSFASGNYSQHSPPNCWWQRETAAISVVQATAFTNTGGQPSTNYGRFHYEDWGEAGDALSIGNVEATHTGPHLLQVLYGNGAGSEESGITCALKRLSVTDEATEQEVAFGALVMPHLGDWARWGESNFITANLQQGRSYRIEIRSDSEYSNMSVFSHFASYTGGLGGTDGEFNKVNIAELRLLAR